MFAKKVANEEIFENVADEQLDQVTGGSLLSNGGVLDTVTGTTNGVLGTADGVLGTATGLVGGVTAPVTNTLAGANVHVKAGLGADIDL